MQGSRPGCLHQPVIVQIRVVAGGDDPVPRQGHRVALVAAVPSEISSAPTKENSPAVSSRRSGCRRRINSLRRGRWRSGWAWGISEKNKPALSLRSRVHVPNSTGRAVLHFVAPGERAPAGRRPVQSHAHAGEIHPLWSELRAIRNPMLLFVLPGVLLLRFASGNCSRCCSNCRPGSPGSCPLAADRFP